ATEMEQRLSEILAEVLKTSRVSATADFFDLGFDSLAAIEIAMKANERGIAMPATAVFEYRTLRSLARYAETLPSESPSREEDVTLIELDEDDLTSITKALG
ncbi:MAG: phosphopantetheine-binding protein, partial [Pseudomonadota bacterium]